METLDKEDNLKSYSFSMFLKLLIIWKIQNTLFEMEGFDDDFAPLQSSDSVSVSVPDPVSAPAVDDDDAPLFLGDEDLEIEKQQNSDGNENNSNPIRCKFYLQYLGIL